MSIKQEIDIEKIVLNQIVGEILKKLPEKIRDQILEKALVNVLENVFSVYEVKHAIRDDAEWYMAEYIKLEQNQQKIKNAVTVAFDNIIGNMVEVFETDIENTIKSRYKSFKSKGD